MITCLEDFLFEHISDLFFPCRILSATCIQWSMEVMEELKANTQGMFNDDVLICACKGIRTCFTCEAVKGHTDSNTNKQVGIIVAFFTAHRALQRINNEFIKFTGFTCKCIG